MVALDEVVAPDEKLQIQDPVTFDDFIAQLFIKESDPHEPSWAGFLRAGFGPDLGFDLTTSASAVLVVRLIGGEGANEMFAFTFGIGGRYLLKPEALERAYGLKTALNLIYPDGEAGNEAQAPLLGVVKKRRTEKVVRSQSQANQASEFEAFEVDRLRDVLTGAVGRPADDSSWGVRVSGADALNFTIDRSFDAIGQLCRDIRRANSRPDYRRRFAWIDNIRPVGDPDEIRQLEGIVLDKLRNKQIDDLDLAPPEIINWELFDGFRFHVDPTIKRPDLRLSDYLRRLEQVNQFDQLSAEFLRSRDARMIINDRPVNRWSMWRCLWGEVTLNGITYILDEGDFFAVDTNYISELDNALATIPATGLDLPVADAREEEGDYNERVVAAAPADRLLMDKKTIRTDATTTAIELCDVLTRQRNFVHVKRHFISKDLSHLFSQAAVAAELLHMNPEFRQRAREQIAQNDANGAFDVIDPARFLPAEYEIVFAIAGDWKGRTLVQRLPFFSKVNLRRAFTDIAARGYKVTHACVPEQ